MNKWPENPVLIPEQDLVRLQSPDKKEVSLENVLKDHRNKLILVDFWASWCIPCRIEIPHFEKMKEEFKDKPVTFISISIDQDDKVEAWITAMKEENLLDQPQQYRFIDFKNSHLTKLINLRTIPRYILLNDKGEIVNREFARPSWDTFVYELNEAIKADQKN